MKHTTGGWNWRPLTRLAYRVGDNELELQVPLPALGFGPADKVALDFHWADNIRRQDDIVEFAVSGDSAPNRRFNYRYVADEVASRP